MVFGGYAAEVFRVAWHAVPKGWAKVARAFGLWPGDVRRLVIAPQLLRHALPVLGILWLVLLTETPLISVVGMEEIIRGPIRRLG